MIARIVTLLVAASVSAAVSATFWFFVVQNRDARPTASLLGIPARIVRPNEKFIEPYAPTWKGLQVKYEGVHFIGGNPRMLYAPLEWGGRTLLPWQSSVDNKPGLFGLYEGNTLTLLDNEIYDLELGELFVRARLDHNGLMGFVPLTIIIGETLPADDTLWVGERVETLKELTCTQPKPITVCIPEIPAGKNWGKAIQNVVGDPSRYDKELSHSGSIHPLKAGNLALTLLTYAMNSPDDERAKSIAATRTLFDTYIMPNAKPGVAGSLVWPYPFEFIINWGIKLSPPWYSAYTNAAMSLTAALMYRLTDEVHYRDVAIKAARFIGEPIETGGAEYTVSGFRLPAEYVYQAAPNARVIDGEIIALIYLYNVARLTGDRSILAIFMRQSMSLAMQLPLYRNPDGSPLFAMYVEKMPDGYAWTMWSALQVLANITKDRRFTEAARDYTPFIPRWSGYKDPEPSTDNPP